MLNFRSKLVSIAFSAIALPHFAFAGALSGTVRVDGSSTVFPITEAAAEDFGAIEAKVRVTVGVSGTGGGFKKFVRNEIDICDASRPIKAEEIAAAAAAKVGYVEFPIAFDGLSIVVNPKNDWVDTLTVAELKRIWEPGSKVKTWKDVRPTWPDRAIKLYGPGTDSGTFDYFTEVINGKAQASRADFTKSEDDNVLVLGISGDKDSLGYFGFSYVQENKGKVKAISIQNQAKAIAPTAESIKDGTYAPLSRKLFIYVTTESLKKPEVYAFVEYYLKKAAAFSKEVGYVALPDESYTQSLKELEKHKGPKNAH
jgi:phosphate transport system substrate-binding protein